MEVIELKSNRNFKTCWMGSTIEMTEDRINVFKDRTIDFAQFQQKRVSILEIKNLRDL